ncbi:uncharacterized protein LOC116349745 [Contarinia nasturtii]|uniref:uncharacterized protein LOC116349745 n=1 Tax=Contarinia nasturtii TaxID=265458 RepID=UPI0012D48D83|nr:uncharacterized protein LOC116349745 [Contarinia nasturtii]XP_031637183.1 uncharacterized protein LOC116349745 [Contarinia nasturtii]
MNRKRYCYIKCCKYEMGTLDDDISFFRMPQDEELKLKWIEIISKHQNMSKTIPSIMVCERHFTSFDYSWQRGRKHLYKEAIPTIFRNEAPRVMPNIIPVKRFGVPRAKYCKIKHCTNETGTHDKSVLFFSVLSNKRMSTAWIQAICRHQDYDFHTKKFMICEEHFTPHDFIEINGKRTLQITAVPSIFVYPDETDCLVQPESHESELTCHIGRCYQNNMNGKNILFFRLPMYGKTRSKWTEAVLKYQYCDFYGLFLICERHFKAEDFEMNRNEGKVLKKGAIPSVFKTISQENRHDLLFIDVNRLEEEPTTKRQRKC